MSSDQEGWANENHGDGWSGMVWSGPASDPLVKLVKESAYRAGGRRSVPIWAHCSGGHDSAARLTLGIEGPAVVLAYHAGDMWLADDADVAEEIYEHSPEAVPPVRMRCSGCETNGQPMSPERLIVKACAALQEWLDKQRAKQPRFVWPKA